MIDHAKALIGIATDGVGCEQCISEEAVMLIYDQLYAAAHELRRLHTLIADCAPYLNKGETPADALKRFANNLIKPGFDDAEGSNDIF